MIKLRHASMALALSIGIGCAPAICRKPITPAPVLAEPPAGIRAVAQVPKTAAPLSSRWNQGDCAFDPATNTLTYSSGDKQIGLKLDAPVNEPLRLLCSDDHTVLLTKAKAAISLGGTQILEGREWIGWHGKSFTWANLYYMDVTEPTAERIRSMEIIGSLLVIKTEAGRRWVLDMDAPENWSVKDPPSLPAGPELFGKKHL